MRDWQVRNKFNKYNYQWTIHSVIDKIDPLQHKGIYLLHCLYKIYSCLCEEHIFTLYLHRYVSENVCMIKNTWHTDMMERHLILLGNICVFGLLYE